MNRLFVYGSLKSGELAHRLMRNAKFVSRARTGPGYSLYRIGYYPGMVVEPSEYGVHGEVYEVSECCLEALDEYEGTGRGLFLRTLVELADGQSAFAYVYNQPLERAKKIEKGIWHE